MPRNPSELNEHVYNNVPQHPAQRSPMLRYALDQDILSDEDYVAFSQQVQSLGQLNVIPWALAVVWVRYFFEHGDGKNYQECLREAVPGLRLLQSDFADLWDSMARTWGVPNEPNVTLRRRFLTECWIVRGGQEAGATSELWRYLNKLLPQLPAAPTDQDIVNVLAVDSDRDISSPYCYQHMLERSQRGDSITDFCDSIRTLKSSAGATGWLAQLPSPAQAAPSTYTDCAWGLRLNGRMADLALKVSELKSDGTTGLKLIIEQSGMEVAQFSVRPNLAAKVLDLSQLIEKGYDPQRPGRVTVKRNNQVIQSGHIAVWPLASTSVLVFRDWKRRDCFQTIVESGEHVQAPRLLLLSPSNQQPSVHLGDQAAQSDYLTTAQNHLKHLNVHRLHLPDNRIQPQPLTNHGQPLGVWVGGKPQLTVNDIEVGVSVLDQEDVAVCFATTIHLSASQCIQPPTVTDWQCESGQFEFEHDDTATASLDLSENLGSPTTVRCGSARAHVLALSANLRPLICAGSGQVDRWTWQIESAPATRCNHAQDGQQLGTLTSPTGVAIRLTTPLAEPIWWFTQAAAQPIPDNLGEIIDAYGHAELPQDLHIAFPQGQEGEILLNGQTIRSSLVGHVSIPLRKELRTHWDLCAGFDQLDTLQLSCLEQTRDLVHVICRPDNPQLFAAGPNSAKVHFPPNQGADGWHLYLIGESSLLTEQITNLSALLRQPEGFDYPLQGTFPGEALWLLLVQQSVTDPARLPKAISKSAHYSLLQVRAADEAQTLNHWLPQWNQGIGLTDAQRNQLRQSLDWIATQPPLPEGLFQSVLEQRNCIAYAHIGTAWNGWFRERCTLDELPLLLRTMLNSGYNWIAEPRWLSASQQWIRDQTAGNWTQAKRGILNQHCALIPAQQILQIANGYRGQGELPFFDRTLLNLDVDSGLKACAPTSGALAYRDGCGIHSIAAGGLTLHGFGLRPTNDFAYHQQVEFRCGDGYHRLRLLVGNDDKAKPYVVDAFRADSQRLCDPNEEARLANIFSSCLTAAERVVGTDADRSLAHLFRLGSQGFQEMASDDEQCNRAIIFHLAVILRLHAWLGWDAAVRYPAQWPLADAANYDFVCVLTSRAWDRPDTARDALMRDLVPIEWFLIWFHQD